RAFQIARKPGSVAGKNLADCVKHHAIAGIATDVGLPVDAAAILAHRRMTDPPPAGRHHARGNRMLRDKGGLGRIGHRYNPPILFHVVRQSAHGLKPHRVARDLEFRMAANALKTVREKSWAASKANPSLSPGRAAASAARHR